MTSLFQKRVYKVVKKIPSGDFLTYKEVAEKAGYPKTWRAVGNVLNKNKNPKIPCHRVIRTCSLCSQNLDLLRYKSYNLELRGDGKIGGYNRGINKKISLLLKEKVINF